MGRSKKVMLLIQSAKVVKTSVDKDCYSGEHKVRGIEYIDGANKSCIIGFSGEVHKELGEVIHYLNALHSQSTLYFNRWCTAEGYREQEEYWKKRADRELGVIKKFSLFERVLFVFFPGKINLYVNKKIELSNGRG